MNASSATSPATSYTNAHSLAGLLRVRGMLPPDVINSAIHAAISADMPLHSYLLQESLISADDLLMLQCEVLGVTPVSLNDYPDHTPIKIAMLDDKLLMRHQVVVLQRSNTALTLGMADITDQAAIDAIRFGARMPVISALVHADALKLRLENHSNFLQIAAHSTFSQDSAELAALDSLINDSSAHDLEDKPAVRFVAETLHDAVRRGASDVHFEPYENSFRVRMRIDGVMQVVATPPKLSAMSIATRLKVLANLDISERRKPQDGRISLPSTGSEFRISTLPTLFGEKIVLRLMGSVSSLLSLDKLGMSASQLALFKEALAKPQGMLLITGATGSGKTASLYAALSALNRPEINILSAEDPVEMNISGINQVNINPKIGLDFADALRAFLRQDPDVIMVGEIRDAATAEIATKAAQTGHLLLSTLHTNSAAESITRLNSMGVPHFHLASSLTLIIAQRLARKLCHLCKIVQEVPAAALKQAGLNEAEIAARPIIYAPVGCPHCRHGYHGRVAIFELLPVTPAIRKLILAGASSHTIATASEQAGNESLRSAAIARMMAGDISLNDMHRITANW